MFKILIIISIQCQIVDDFRGVPLRQFVELANAWHFDDFGQIDREESSKWLGGLNLAKSLGIWAIYLTRY
jgi:hypothetical protein